MLEFADSYNMLPRGANIICALSGGADSVCLLSVLNTVKEERGLKLYAAHFNHRLRAAESDRDENFVRELCKKLGIELFCASEDVEAYARKNRVGTEEAARKLRYAFFEKTAEKIPESRVATAHNANDNAETILMNIIRGAGLKGICGIPPIRGIYIRPLLRVSREEILKYLAENNIDHVEDSTNAEELYTRNKLRHRVLPVLGEINGDFTGAFAQCSELLRRDEELLESLSRKAVKCEKNSLGELEFNAAELIKLPFSLSSRAIRRAAESFNVAVSMIHVGDILKLAGSERASAEINIPGGIYVLKKYNKLIFTDRAEKNISFEPRELIFGEWTELAEIGKKVYFGEKNKKIEYDEIFNFKKSDLCGKITLRPRAGGDKIYLSRNVGKSLKKLFTELKIPRSRRGAVPVIADEAGVLAVSSVGQNLARAAKSGEADCIVAVKNTGDSTGEKE